MRVSVAKWGNSLAIRLPKEAAASIGLLNGTLVDLVVNDETITLRRRRYDIDDLVRAIGAAEPPPLVFDDPPRGSEIW